MNLSNTRHCGTRPARALSVLALLALLSGCALPAAAPTSRELVSSQDSSDLSYALVHVDSRVIHTLRQSSSFGPTFRGRKYVPKNTLRPGDAVSITIYETGGSSLFPPPSSAAMPAMMASLGTPPSSSLPPVNSGGTSAANTIPPQVVEADGTISVPFAGRLKVVGLTPGQVGSLVERELKHKAVAPQVIVSLAANTSNSATVSGEVNAPRLVPLSLRGERLLDVVAAAGGSKFPAYETYVRVVRAGNVGTMLLQSVVSNPTENIVIQPNDQIYLTRNTRTFVVLGATQRPSLFPFEREKVSLAEAIAMAGGPIDTIGDPSGIYLFRFEPWYIARQVMDPQRVKSMGTIPPEFVPVLYRVGLRDAQGYFLSQAIDMRDKDVVLISNAEGTQLLKLLTLVRGFTGIAYDLKRQYTLH